MDSDFKLYQEGLEEFPFGGVLFENFIIVLWLALGGLCCYFMHPLSGAIYIGVGVFMIYIVLRKVVCPNCYYYGKRCHNGWGKLSAMMFKKGDISKFDKGATAFLPPVTYMSLSLTPIILLIISLISEFTYLKAGILLVTILLTAYSMRGFRKKGCNKCKMRLSCSGCVVKNQ